MIIIAIYLERYRSGHNEAVLKTVCPKGRVGSNPTLSALRGSLKELPFCITGSFFTGRSSLGLGIRRKYGFGVYRKKGWESYGARVSEISKFS